MRVVPGALFRWHVNRICRAWEGTWECDNCFLAACQRGNFFIAEVLTIWWYVYYTLYSNVVRVGALVVDFLKIWWFLLVGSSLFVNFMIEIERDDSLQSTSVRLNGKNYSFYSIVIMNFIKEKDCEIMLVELLWNPRTPLRIKW